MLKWPHNKPLKGGRPKGRRLIQSLGSHDAFATTSVLETTRVNGFFKLVALLIFTWAGLAEAQQTCPVSLGAHYDEAPFPEFLWYRVDSLAVAVPHDGVA